MGIYGWTFHAFLVAANLRFRLVDAGWQRIVHAMDFMDSEKTAVVTLRLDRLFHAVFAGAKHGFVSLQHDGAFRGALYRRRDRFVLRRGCATACRPNPHTSSTRSRCLEPDRVLQLRFRLLVFSRSPLSPPMFATVRFLFPLSPRVML